MCVCVLAPPPAHRVEQSPQQETSLAQNTRTAQPNDLKLNTELKEVLRNTPAESEVDQLTVDASVHLSV